jgi:hypothetical protein
MKTVAIVPGWSEGPWQSRKFRQLLKGSGFKVTKNVRDADIILAHSAGCFWIPINIRAALILLVGPNYWPGRSYFMAAVLNTVGGLKHHRANGSVIWWATKLLHNTWYILSRPLTTLRLFKHVTEENLPFDGARKILLIRNQRDSFCHPDIQELLPKTKGYKFLEFEGDHEDCWLNPQPYVDLIQKELK